MTQQDLIVQGENRREEILDFIAAYHAEWGFAPSMDEIAQGVGVVKNAARHHLLKLQQEGKVCMTPGKYRSLRLTGDTDGALVQKNSA